jgi:NADPH:quinone reductase-like Zn-dependent oxidoreductase
MEMVMAQMRAVTFAPGGSENLQVTSMEIPAPGPTEVLVRASAVGVNSIDWKTRAGEGMYRFFDPAEPMVLGWDIAGVVQETGVGVTRFHKGDRVFGMPRFPDPAKAYAQYVVAPSRQLAGVPKRVSDVAAAAVPLPGLTAYQAVVDTLKLGQGERILINGAAGAVGQFAVQIARARRATVWAVDVPDRLDILTSLGVDHVIDAASGDSVESISHMDAVLDLVGGNESSAKLLGTLQSGGRMVVLSSPDDVPSEQQLEAAGVTASWMLVEPDHAGLEALAAMLSYGLLRVHVAQTRPFDDIADLHDLGESGTVVGRLVATL